MLQISNKSTRYDGNNRISESFFIELTGCFKYAYEEDCNLPLINSECYTVILVLTGGILIRETGMVAEKNEVLFIPKFSGVKLTAEKNTEILKVVFNMSEQLHPTGKKLLSVRILSDTVMQFLKLYNAVHFQNVLPGTKEAILLNVMNDIKMQRNLSFSQTDTKTSLYKNVCRFIEQNSTKDISPKDVSQALGYSREHLNRIVKSVDNECLSEKIARHRLEKIKGLCGVKNISVESIAKRLDFYSAELLCKYFKYHTGISISDYRKNII